MSEPVKSLDSLTRDALIFVEAQRRPIEGQLERSLPDLIAIVDTDEGRARLKAYLDSEPFPHFEEHPSVEGALIRIEEDGSRSAGQFVNRVWTVSTADEASNPVDCRAKKAKSGRSKAGVEAKDALDKN